MGERSGGEQGREVRGGAGRGGESQFSTNCYIPLGRLEGWKGGWVV